MKRGAGATGAPAQPTAGSRRLASVGSSGGYRLGKTGVLVLGRRER
jgi:hypothetical protein